MPSCDFITKILRGRKGATEIIEKTGTFHLSDKNTSSSRQVTISIS